MIYLCPKINGQPLSSHLELLHVLTTTRIFLTKIYFSRVAVISWILCFIQSNITFLGDVTTWSRVLDLADVLRLAQTLLAAGAAFGIGDKVNYMVNLTGHLPELPLPDEFYNATNVSIVRNGTNLSEAGVGLDFDTKHPAIGVALAFFSFITIFGNSLVIVAVAKEMYLRTVTNYFIVSLAVADVMVGGLVMPFSISYEMTNQNWLYGSVWCDLWHSFDVLASTASILNLCVISLDRYWAITDPIAYPNKMSTCKVCVMITCVWVCSAGISFPAIAWWKAVTPTDLPQHMCLFTEDTAYLIFSSVVSFYCPTVIMMFVYYKIYRAAREQMKSLKMGTKVFTANGSHGHHEVMTLRMHRGGMSTRRKTHERDELQLPSLYDKSPSESDNDNPAIQMLREDSSQPDSDHSHRPTKFITKRLKQFAISKKLTKVAREQKAAKTLGIVVGVFIICWLPFFITNALYGICHDACVLNPGLLFPVVTWLGYINSGMNPVIYALSMRDFRRAFTRIICLCCPRYRYTQRRNNYNCSSLSTSSFTANCAERCATLRM